jgi:hypothetical protein
MSDPSSSEPVSESLLERLRRHLQVELEQELERLGFDETRRAVLTAGLRDLPPTEAALLQLLREVSEPGEQDDVN